MKHRTILLAALLLLATAVPVALQAGAADQAVTDSNLTQMISSAKTAADHAAIAAYYDKEAADNEAKAKLHHSVHHTYEQLHLKPPSMAQHCNELAKWYQRVADEDKKLAAEQRKLAK